MCCSYDSDYPVKPSMSATRSSRTTPRRGETNREEAVNVHLAQLLRERGISARAERRSRHGAPDLRIDLSSGYQIIIECKYADSSGQLEPQLNDRLTHFPKAIAVLGVVYPDSMRHEPDVEPILRTASDIEWWLHGSLGETIADRRVRSGSVADLADNIRVLPLDIEGLDTVQAAAVVVGNALEESANQIFNHARIARLISDLIAKSDKEKDRAAAIRIGCLVLFNALAFQDRLAQVDDEVATVNEALLNDLDGLYDVWQYVIDHIDYQSVFELAGNIVDVLKLGPPEVQLPVIEPLARAVKDTRTLEGHDLAGRLFHTLLSDAKFTGAYYTSVPAATLLSRLVFHDWPAGVDWSDHEFPASLEIADLACGTGTLLIAVASEVERKHLEAGGTDAAALHKKMVEQALHGYDVQLSAVHFAATSLAMLNPEIKFDHMSLYEMAIGAEGSNILLGSLEFLNKNEAAVQYALSAEDIGVTTRDARRVSGRGSRGVKEGETATLPDLDLAIMNPPFTRSVGGNLLFGSLPQSERRKLQRELSLRLKSIQASSTAGLGSAFVAAASPKLRPGEGRLALVLPLTVCTGPSWSQTRALIENDYVLDVVISSHDPDRWNFSDSTDLSEALLIATRRPENNQTNDEHRTTFVNLWRNPKGVLDAHRVAEAINTTQPAKLEDAGTALLDIDGEHAGESFSIPESRLARMQWAGVQFARADIVRSAMRLLVDGEVWVPGEQKVAKIAMCRLEEIGAIGPDRRDLWDGFERTDSVTAYPMVENHETEKRKRLVTEPDRYLAPLVEARPGRNLKPYDQLWPKAGRILVCERLGLNTARVVAMRTESPVLSNVWWSVRNSTDAVEKALVVWMNSSIGILALLAKRNTTHGGWVALKKADLKNLPILDPRRLSDDQLDRLAGLFDELVDVDFERLPDMTKCPARTALDDGLSDILGLPDLSTLRLLIATEPVVSNRGL